jgi:hypothetical protein
MTHEIIIYKSPSGSVRVDVTLENDTFWLTQNQIADLFGTTRPNITMHLKNIFESGELDKLVVSKEFLQTTEHGAIKGKTQTKSVRFYNLDAIIAIGYRVNSRTATEFRVWATKILNEYIRKGFAMDDERLKELGGGSYWKELLQRIRDIRASEKVFYRQVLDIYATSVDYDPRAKVSLGFFKKVQNKIHYAVHGQTAAEVIFDRVDAEKEFMGLTTFAGDQPTLTESKIAKNYLDEKELRAMGQIVSGYLDFAERQAERQVAMKMVDWATHLDKILTVSGEKLLRGAGRVSHEKAIAKVAGEYKKYQNRTLSGVERDYLAMIDSISKETERGKK